MSDDEVAAAFEVNGQTAGAARVHLRARAGERSELGPAVKLIENHEGRTYARIEQQITLPLPLGNLPFGQSPIPIQAGP